jgi:hypothetical protein
MPHLIKGDKLINLFKGNMNYLRLYVCLSELSKDNYLSMYDKPDWSGDYWVIN